MILEKVTNTIEGVLENRNEHILRNKRLIWSVVQRFINRGYDPDDLFQIGALGYMKAFERFDDSYKVKWSTYAVPMIIGEIQRFIRDDGIIKTPRRLKELATKFRYSECEGLKREEIAEKLELDLSEVDELLYFMKVRNPSSIEQTVYENDGDPLTIADQVGDFDDYSHTFVNEFLETLDERTVKVVKLVMDGKTQSEIGEIIGVSQVQVSRIVKNQVKPLLENYLKGQGQFDNVVKERAPQVRKPKPKNIKKQESVVMYKVNKKKPLNGLTVDIYNAMRAEGKTNTQIKLHFKLSNNVFFTWKKENGLTDKAKSARIIKGLKENSVQGEKEMMATAIKPSTSASQVSKLDKVITNLEETVEGYKLQVASRDQEIKRMKKEADQKHAAFEEAVGTLNATWENKVLEKDALIKNLRDGSQHAENNIKHLKGQLNDVTAACRDLSEENVRLKEMFEQIKYDFDNVSKERDSLETDYQRRHMDYERVLKEKHQLSERYDHLEEEGKRVYNEALELKRLYEEELKRANEADAYSKIAERNYETLQEKYNALDFEKEQAETKIAELEQDKQVLAEKVQSYDKNIDRILEEATQAQRLHQEEVKMLHDKIDKLQSVLKLYL
jgi:RNA polymerase sporulation-specific sigma factor